MHTPKRITAEECILAARHFRVSKNTAGTEHSSLEVLHRYSMLRLWWDVQGQPDRCAPAELLAPVVAPNKLPPLVVKGSSGRACSNGELSAARPCAPWCFRV